MYVCTTKNPGTGHIPDWKTNELQNMSRNIYRHLKSCFLEMLVFSHAEIN